MTRWTGRVVLGRTLYMCPAMRRMITISLFIVLALVWTTEVRAALSKDTAHRPVRVVELASHSKAPGSISLKLTTNGQAWIIDAELNSQSFSSHFRRSHHRHTGEEVVMVSNNPRHFPTECHYHGRVRGSAPRSSWAAVSKCDDITLSFSDGKEKYSVQPSGTDASQYIIFKETDMDTGAGKCGVSDKVKVSRRRTRSTGRNRAAPNDYWKERPTTYSTIVELSLFIDKAAYDKIGSVRQVTVKMMDYVNMMDLAFKPLGVRVTLTHLTIWNMGDPFTPYQPIADYILRKFKRYCQRHGYLHNRSLTADHHMLFSGYKFNTSTVGLAYYRGICDDSRFSVVQQFSNSREVGVMTHELGHALGMRHDNYRPCNNCSTDGTNHSSCLMNHYLRWGPPVFKFSACSVQDYQNFMAFGHGQCLFNTPKKIFGGPVCGNGFVEAGEQCDCGTDQDCGSELMYCNMDTCRFQNGAQCLNSDPCCSDRKITKNTKSLCRSATDDCDLPEYCDAQSSKCPEDMSARNGWPCANDKAYCWNGMCQTYDNQCIRLWGKDIDGAAADVFAYLNLHGDISGNCGYDHVNRTYIPCALNNIRCGKLWCQPDLTVTPEMFGDLNSSFSIHPRYTNDTFEFGSSINFFAGSNDRDPSLASDGARCDIAGSDPNLICSNQQCVQKSTVVTQCALDANNTECKGFGICTNRGTCFYPLHCRELSLPFANVKIKDNRTGNGFATVSCKPGYWMSENGTNSMRATSKCGVDGQWATLPPCTPITCGHVRKPKNGKISRGTSFVFDIVTFGCQFGYELVGSRATVCLSTGIWSSTPPTCKRIKCSMVPPHPQNGVLGSGSIALGSIRVFSCNPGYMLSGTNGITTCRPDKTWSLTRATCTRRPCLSLPSIPNGVVLGGRSSFVFGDVVQIRCMTGYNGSSAVSCLANGTWSRLTCSQMYCQRPTKPNHGQVHVTSRTFKSMATFTCNAGYSLVGSHKSRCTKTMQWSNPEPTCQKITCPLLTNPAHGRVLPGSTDFQTARTYSCNDGYVLSGQACTTCQLNGTWSSSPPSCARKPCPTLPIVPNGVALTTQLSHSYLDRLHIQCNVGWSGGGTVNCLANGTWSNSICVEIECPALAPPTNGQVIVGKRTYQSLAAFTCQAGFNLVGHESAVCTWRGEWSHPEPSCQRVTCPTLVAPGDGYVANGSCDFQAIRAYTCRVGYELIGQSTTHCQLNGTWSSPSPTCTPKTCRDLIAPANGGVVMTGNTTYGSVANFTCQIGFDLIGSEITACTESGQWSNVEPTCKRCTCRDLTQPKNGDVLMETRSFESVATFTCDFGYSLVGSENTTCTGSCEWSDVEPSCKRIKVCPVFEVQNGNITSSLTGNNARQIHVQCSPGYWLDGENRAVCLITGEWSSTPKCRRIKICSVFELENGNITITSSLTGNNSSHIHVECHPGYRLEGQSRAVCLTTGEWSSTPKCTQYLVSSTKYSASGVGIGFGLLMTCVSIAVLLWVRCRRTVSKKAGNPNSLVEPPALGIEMWGATGIDLSSRMNAVEAGLAGTTLDPSVDHGVSTYTSET